MDKISLFIGGAAMLIIGALSTDSAPYFAVGMGLIYQGISVNI